ncbi:hypothetical protein BDY19DRAFT_998363 [Irpex rosettiformis]|uniref:Uncharacterized protein n=1 Tax=Irpex rosettiformis TaxID=378272 RepID=A0ACB8TPH6_9APHY|nr:hypothetical protein BDY19DRAFT_998363 [Irpex rosettiformis]
MSSRTLHPLSAPNVLDTPAIMWATENDVPGFPGLYVSPTSRTLPVVEPTRSRQNRSDRWPPLPWQWFYTRFANQVTYWTALCPTTVPYEGLLEHLGSNEVVEIQTAQGAQWRLSDVEGWERLEALLQRLLSAMTAAGSLDSQTPLLVQVRQLSPWPMAYRYAETWPSRAQAKRAVNMARAVFKIIIASIMYASYLMPKDWLEHLHHLGVLTTAETNLIRESVICQATNSTSGQLFQHVGCILDMRVDFPNPFLEEVKYLTEKFALPIWFYYGDQPSRQSTNPWYSVYLPNEGEITASKCYGHSVTSVNWDDDVFGDASYMWSVSATTLHADPPRTGWSPPTHQSQQEASPTHWQDHPPTPSNPHTISQSPLPQSLSPSHEHVETTTTTAVVPTISHLRNPETRQSRPGDRTKNVEDGGDRESKSTCSNGRAP